MPPIAPKPKLNRRVVLIAGSVAVVLTVALMAGLAAWPRARRALAPELDAAAVIKNSQEFGEPLVLLMPSRTSLQRGSPEDQAYAALASLELVTVRTVDYRHYRRQRRPNVEVELRLTERGFSEAAGWKLAQADTWQIPLAYRQLVAVRPTLDLPNTYWVQWRWTATPLGDQLRPALRKPYGISAGVITSRAVLARDGSEWHVVSFSDPD